MKTASFRFWTRIVKSTFDENICYATKISMQTYWIKKKGFYEGICCWLLQSQKELTSRVGLKQ